MYSDSKSRHLIWTLVYITCQKSPKSERYSCRLAFSLRSSLADLGSLVSNYLKVAEAWGPYT